jgi:phosphatidylinositol phospholipase C, delta
MEHFPTERFELPESLLSRKTSSNSLGRSTLVGTPSAMSEAIGKGSLMRRLSNRAQQFASRRRQSSAAPNSRDGSIGPGLLRRRSDSNNTAPPDFSNAVLTDSDDDFVDEKDDLSVLCLDGNAKDSSPSSGNASVAGSTSPTGPAAGPVIPLQLLKGTWIRKVSKRFILVLEPDAGKISWDRNRPQKCLYLDDIKEIRTGTDIRQYRLDFGIPEQDESRWFSILYATPEAKSRNKMMHLIPDDHDTYYNWVGTLDQIAKHRENLMTSLMAFNDKAIRGYWQTEMSKQFADKPHSPDEETLDFEGVERVCRNLHIHASPSQLVQKFQASDCTETHRLNFAEFQNFVGLMKQRHDIRDIFVENTADWKAGMTFKEFLAFLRDVQREDVDANLPTWEAVFANVKFTRKSKNRDAEKQGPVPIEDLRMSDAVFAEFLTSTYNVPLIEEPREFTLDRPMNEYFISSSHNTYLLGRQVMGVSSNEGYIAALMRGCRCVEVDCWDGGDGQPVVNHGRTLTSSISFEQVMGTIKKYAFYTSKFPLWISLEVHCNAIQQEIMARIIKDTFGTLLVTEPLDPGSGKLPSPSELMERVLIKVKKPLLQPKMKTQSKEDGASNAEPSTRRRGNSLSSPYIRPIATDNSTVPSQSLPQSPMLSPSHLSRRLASRGRVNTINEGEVQEPTSSSPSETDSGGEVLPSKKKTSNRTVKVLGELGVYCAGVKFTGFDTPDAKEYNHIFSFMESSFTKNSRTKDEKKALDLHNMRYLMRVYPDRTRITSNNFDPLIYWRRGVQMSALNWQTFDLGMQLNHAMFMGGTDATGYVLKPSELREFQHLPGGWNGKRERKEVSFHIDVISAQQLMRPNGMPVNKTVDPYIEVEVFHSNDKRDKKEAGSTISPIPDTPLKRRTHIVPGNGFNPIFGNRFAFKVTTKYPDLIFVRWSVKLSNDGINPNDRPPVATYTAKLTNLKQGYRTLPLLNPAGEQYLFSTLFCRINVDSIETVLFDYVDQQRENGNKLKGIGRGVFNRSNTSPKSSMEKSSFDGSIAPSPPTTAT